MKKVRRSKSGITLITLAITIVVLLILASIATYSGMEVIKSSKLTVFTTELKMMQSKINEIYQKYKDNEVITINNECYYGENKEEGQKSILEIGTVVQDQSLQLLIQQLKGDAEKYRVWDNNLIKQLGIEGVEGRFLINILERSIISCEGLEYEGKIYHSISQLPDSLYNVKYEHKETIGAKEIYEDSDKSQYYGAIVNGYTCQNSQGVNNWKIFYADKDHIYLITDDYIHYDDAPKGSGGSSLSKYNNYKMGFSTGILSGYSGSSDITDSKIQKLNDQYFEYLTTNNVTSSSNDMKAVAYMLDTQLWSGFKGNIAEYSIGGPTIEIFMNSYSQKHNVDYRTQAYNKNGYKISKDGGKTWEFRYDKLLNTKDNFYVGTNKATGVWIASPSAYANFSVMYVGYDGYVGYTTYSINNYGFRPLVCLQPSVRLEKTGDGQYTIVQ